MLTPPLAKLIDTFQKLPGVGPKTAQRLAFHVLKQPSDFSQQFAHALTEAKASIRECSVCHNLTANDPCEICSNTSRHQHQVCVVAQPQDLMALERTHQYRGLYHILGGVISPLEGRGPDQLNMESLLKRCPVDSSDDGLKEVILALPPTTEGDTTSLYLARLLKPLGLQVTRIAFGLPVGGDLDYADQLTITRALEGRSSL